MSILICDICGTSYSDTDEKCPTCGYGRSFDAAELEQEAQRPHAAHEKVRGGRFSKKNVRKRMVLKEQGVAAVEPTPVEDPERQEAAAVIVPIPPVQEPAAEAPVQVKPEEPEVSAQPGEEEAEKEAQRKLLAAYRRDVIHNLLMFVSMVLFVGSIVYLAMHVDFSRLGSYFQPGPSVIATEPSTEPPTQPPTDPPTEPPTDPPTDPPTEPPTDPPTDPPTEPPTDPPTEPPTDPPTEPLLDVKLTLNYYDLTFAARTHTTQLRAEGIPLEDITWISDDTSIVTISDTGLITAVGGGRTTVRAIYGDQEVTVKINCRF